MPMITPVALPGDSQSFSPPPIHLNGKPLPPHKVFFLPAPPEIGPLLCGESTLKEGKRPLSLLVRLLLTIPLVATFAIAGIWLANKLEPLPGETNVSTWFVFATTLTLCLGAFFASLKATRFEARCSYVGELGAVRYTVTGSLQQKPLVEFLLFENAARLFTSKTNNYIHSSYSNTDYLYEWVDAQGRKVMRLLGAYCSKEARPYRDDPYYFAHATELAWSQFLLKRADAELDEQGFLYFPIKTGALLAVHIGPGFIEFHFNERVDRCEVGDIKSIDLANGLFTIKHRDAKWYSSKGKFTFSYRQIANAQLFVLALNRFLPSSAWYQQEM